MRWAWVLPLLICTADASARSYRPRREPTLARHEFWRDVIEPNFYDISRLTELANRALRTVEDAMVSDTGWAAEERQKYVLDAYHLLKHARTLAPKNLEVLALLGRAADDAGKTKQAIEAFEAHIKIAGIDQAAAAVLARYGAIEIRMGNNTHAIELLKHAQGQIQNAETGRDHAFAAIYLANAYAAEGDATAAVDTLAAAVPAMTQYYYFGTSAALLGFALAVQYDRNEQRGAAFEQLDKLQSTLSQGGSRMFQTHLLEEIARVPFAPAEDVHYYRALLYEALAKYVEARVEWATYAAVPDALWRARALEHIQAIDTPPQRAAPEDPNAQSNPGGITIPQPTP